MIWKCLEKKLGGLRGVAAAFGPSKTVASARRSALLARIVRVSVPAIVLRNQVDARWLG